MKKMIAVLLLAVALSAVFAGCTQTTSLLSEGDGGTVSGDSTPAPTAASEEDDAPATASPAPSASPKATEVPEEAEQAAMTAAEAAEDQEAIENEIADVRTLIEEELYDDALMSVKALLTKELTDEQKNEVMELKQLIEAKLGSR